MQWPQCRAAALRFPGYAQTDAYVTTDQQEKTADKSPEASARKFVKADFFITRRKVFLSVRQEKN